MCVMFLFRVGRCIPFLASAVIMLITSYFFHQKSLMFKLGKISMCLVSRTFISGDLERKLSIWNENNRNNFSGAGGY